MPGLVASAGKSIEACRLSPTWNKAATTVSSRSGAVLLLGRLLRGVERCGEGLPAGVSVTSRITARVNWPAAVGTGLRLICAGKVVPSWRIPTSRARSPISRILGAWWIAGPQPAVPVLQIRWDEELDRVAEQLIMPVAEHRSRRLFASVIVPRSSASATPSWKASTICRSTAGATTVLGSCGPPSQVPPARRPAAPLPCPSWPGLLRRRAAVADSSDG